MMIDHPVTVRNEMDRTYTSSPTVVHMGEASDVATVTSKAALIFSIHVGDCLGHA